jgi:hypothetical protein
MTHQSATQLDTFETALLTELKAAVSETATAAPRGGPGTLDRPDVRHLRRWPIPVALAAAAALATALLVPGLSPTPAYAVTGRNDGEVHVRVTRLEGADGLEQALREHGIPADISYLPAGKECAPGRYTDVRTPGMVLGVSLNEFEVTIPPGAVGEDDTFVLSAAVVPIQDGFQATVDFGIAHGAVEPCQVVDSP